LFFCSSALLQKQPWNPTEVDPPFFTSMGFRRKFFFFLVPDEGRGLFYALQYFSIVFVHTRCLLIPTQHALLPFFNCPFVLSARLQRPFGHAGFSPLSPRAQIVFRKERYKQSFLHLTLSSFSLGSLENGSTSHLPITEESPFSMQDTKKAPLGVGAKCFNRLPSVL